MIGKGSSLGRNKYETEEPPNKLGRPEIEARGCTVHYMCHTSEDSYTWIVVLTNRSQRRVECLSIYLKACLW